MITRLNEQVTRHCTPHHATRHSTTTHHVRCGSHSANARCPAKSMSHAPEAKPRTSQVDQRHSSPAAALLHSSDPTASPQLWAQLHRCRWPQRLPLLLLLFWRRERVGRAKGERLSQRKKSKANLVWKVKSDSRRCCCSGHSQHSPCRGRHAPTAARCDLAAAALRSSAKA